MRNLIIGTALVISSVGFASQSIVAPVGKYVALSCRSNQPGKPFSLSVVKHTRSSKIEMRLNAEGQEQKVYPNTREIVSTRIGGSVSYVAPAAGGQLKLEVNFTTSPNQKGGRRGVVTSSIIGRTTKTEMLCNQVMY